MTDPSAGFVRYRDLYARDGLVVLPRLLHSSTTTLLSSYTSVLGHLGRLVSEERQVKGSLVTYGDALFDTVMASFCPIVAEVVGRPVLPTYSFLRVYHEGQVLTPHRDRRACQHSLTLHLTAAPATASVGAGWPVDFEDLHGRHRSVALTAGDAALYQGCALRHWRAACPLEWYVQVFLHYVEASGPFADQAFDGREYLGMPSNRRTPDAN